MINLWISLAFVLAGIAVLTLGNPQWGSWLYLVQARLFPARGSEYRGIDPPTEFVGVWKDWDRNGEYLRTRFRANGTTEVLFDPVIAIDRR